jgi:predicted nuclease of predicted toxin-antitoxin system
LAGLLRDRGHDAAHTLELGLERAEDDALLMLAAHEGRVIVSGDTDFGALLALLRREARSVILFRSQYALAAEDQASTTATISTDRDLGGQLGDPRIQHPDVSPDL